jgi:hypothetical protein
MPIVIFRNVSFKFDDPWWDRSSADTPFLPFLSDGDDVDFENKSLRTAGNPIAPFDAVNLELLKTTGEVSFI